MPQERLSYFHRRLPRIGASFSFWWSKIVTSSTEDSHKKEANNHAKENTKQRPNGNRTARKAYLMSGFLSVIIFIIATILTSIAIAVWQKGGYRNYWIAFGWGIAAYVMLGVGAFFTYYYYVIKPAKAVATRIQPVITERPELFTAFAQMDSFVAGKPNTGRVAIKNTGKATAYDIDICTTSELRPRSLEKPLEYGKAKPGTPPRTVVEALPPGEYLTLMGDAAFTMTQEMIALVANGSHLLFFFGIGRYRDTNSKQYPIKFCFVYNRDTPASMDMCPAQYLPKEDDPNKECPHPN